MVAPLPGDFVGLVDFVAQATAGAHMTIKKVQFGIQAAKLLGSAILPAPMSNDFAASMDASEFKNGDYKIVAIAEDTAASSRL